MSQHLDSLKIEHFRGLNNLELQNLGQVNLLVGPNNTGKTSVLEALSIYCRSFDPLEWLDTSRRREALSSRPITRLNTLRWLFPQVAEQKADELYQGQIGLQTTGRFAVRSVTAKYQEIQGLPDEATLKRILKRTEPREVYRGAELQVSLVAAATVSRSTLPAGNVQNLFTFWEAAPFYSKKNGTNYALPVKTITPVAHRIERELTLRFTETALNRKKDELLALVRLFDPEIVDLLILKPDETNLYVDHRKTGLTPLSAFGDGLRRVVMMALTLPQVSKGVLLIDEIETAIHYGILGDVCQWLFKACAQNDVQLFATTHSLEAVDALLNTQNPPNEDLVVYRLGQTGEAPKRLSGDLLYHIRNERGLDVR